MKCFEALTIRDDDRVEAVAPDLPEIQGGRVVGHR